VLIPMETKWKLLSEFMLRLLRLFSDFVANQDFVQPHKQKVLQPKRMIPPLVMTNNMIWSRIVERREIVDQL
jgi:hypothetical protein